MLKPPADRPEILAQGSSEFLVKVLQTLPVEPYELATAEAHGGRDSGPTVSDPAQYEGRVPGSQRHPQSRRGWRAGQRWSVPAAPRDG